MENTWEYFIGIMFSPLFHEGLLVIYHEDIVVILKVKLRELWHPPKTIALGFPHSSASPNSTSNNSSKLIFLCSYCFDSRNFCTKKAYSLSVPECSNFRVPLCSVTSIPPRAQEKQLRSFPTFSCYKVGSEMLNFLHIGTETRKSIDSDVLRKIQVS